MPLIRYRTRDLTSIVPGPCPCGSMHKRIARIKGRSDDMFIIKGVNVFPMQVETLLKGELLFTPKVALVEPDSLPKSEGKALRVVDHRRKE